MANSFYPYNIHERDDRPTAGDLASKAGLEEVLTPSSYRFGLYLRFGEEQDCERASEILPFRNTGGTFSAHGRRLQRRRQRRGLAPIQPFWCYETRWMIDINLHHKFTSFVDRLWSERAKIRKACRLASYQGGLIDVDMYLFSFTTIPALYFHPPTLRKLSAMNLSFDVDPIVVDSPLEPITGQGASNEPEKP